MTVISPSRTTKTIVFLSVQLIPLVLCPLIRRNDSRWYGGRRARAYCPQWINVNIIFHRNERASIELATKSVVLEVRTGLSPANWTLSNKPTKCQIIFALVSQLDQKGRIFSREATVELALLVCTYVHLFVMLDRLSSSIDFHCQSTSSRLLRLLVLFNISVKY